MLRVIRVTLDENNREFHKFQEFKHQQKVPKKKRVGGGITKRLSLPLYHLLLKRLGILFIQTTTVN
jgi:hypothetical protein